MAKRKRLNKSKKCNFIPEGTMQMFRAANTVLSFQAFEDTYIRIKNYKGGVRIDLITKD